MIEEKDTCTHMHKQGLFGIIFIILRKLLVSDFYSTGQSCEQSWNAYQKVTTYLPLSGLSLHKDHVSSAHRTPLPLYILPVTSMFVLSPFQEAQQWEGHSVNVIPWPSFFHDATKLWIRYYMAWKIIHSALRLSPKITSVLIIYCCITNCPET